MEFSTNLPEMIADLKEVARLFDPDLAENYSVRHLYCQEGNDLRNQVTVNGVITERQDSLPEGCSPIESKRYVKRYAKLALYAALSGYYKREMPWGALTGIRPTKLYYQLLRSETEADLPSFYRDTFLVSPQKIELLADIIAHQENLINRSENTVDVYAGIPFCTSRCAYCSFLSAEIGVCGKWVEPYVESLLHEIEELKTIVREKGYRVRAAYIGGGTPTSLPTALFKRVVGACAFGQQEFTCEAGRPDTIDAEKLDAMLQAGVNRISVNPQTFHNKTLERIGRKHTVEEFEKSFALVRRFPFAVNLDLIAGLPGENREDFIYSVNRAASLAPSNITVHTLALKSGAALKEQGYQASPKVPEMVEYAYQKLKECEYLPYYMYRQKYMASNLENVGYCRENSACLYNVDIMEENTSVLAAGANAITKRVFLEEDRIERQANNKDIASYVQNIDKLIERKRKLFFL